MFLVSEVPLYTVCAKGGRGCVSEVSYMHARLPAGKGERGSSSLTRVLPTGPNPPYPLDDFSRLALRHESLNSLFHVA